MQPHRQTGVSSERLLYAFGGLLLMLFVAIIVFTGVRSAASTDDPFFAVAADSAPVETVTTTTGPPPTAAPAERTRPVPDVTGLEVDDAILMIFEWNLQFELTDEVSADASKGVVIRTEPESGTLVDQDAVVVLVVSAGEG